MKLSNVLSVVNQIEKSKFINFLDRICSEASQTDKTLANKLKNIDGHIKDASSSEVTQLFNLASPLLTQEIKRFLLLSSPQSSLLINILIRDGNSVTRIPWIEHLYLKEWSLIDHRSNQIKEQIANVSDNEIYDNSRRLAIYHSCLNEAFNNDQRSNREARITDEERGILNVLAQHLDITADDKVAIEHLVIKIEKTGVQECLNQLREIGLVFISKKNNTVYMPDEIVTLLSKIHGKQVADKHFIRLLRALTDPELSNILKAHGKKMRGLSRDQKIIDIKAMGLTVSQLLSEDIFTPGSSLNDKKERLKQIIEDLKLNTEKLGSTLEERCGLIINALNNLVEQEFNVLSAAGYKALYDSLCTHHDGLPVILQREFQLEDNAPIDVEVLRALSITPFDILYVLSNDQVKELRLKMGISRKGEIRIAIIESFANATDKLIDNYELLAARDLAALKQNGIDIAEADIGVKFEEVTKAIFEQLGFDVDEDLRRSMNTSKDKADIIISLSEDDIIIGETKTCKNGDFAKYSNTSRQIKAYATRCESMGKRVAQVLIIAPRFSTDFVESAEMDTEVNISLLEASGLKTILEAYKARRHPKFSVKLLTKGGLLKANLIAKNI